MEEYTIGKNIARLRRASGMTQRELADRLFVSDKSVSRWECDECEPDVSMIVAISDVFGVTTDELIRGKKPAREADERSYGTKRPENQAERAEESGKGKEEKIRMVAAKNLNKYRVVATVCLCLYIIGFVCALLINRGYDVAADPHRGGIWNAKVAFYVAAAVFAVAAILQNAFAVAFGTQIYGEADKSVGSAFNKKIVVYCVLLDAIAVFVTLFCTPLVTKSGYVRLPDGIWFSAGGKLVMTVAGAVSVAATVILSVAALCGAFDRKAVGSGEAGLVNKPLIIELLAVFALTLAVILWKTTTILHGMKFDFDERLLLWFFIATAIYVAMYFAFQRKTDFTSAIAEIRTPRVKKIAVIAGAAAAILTVLPVLGVCFGLSPLSMLVAECSILFCSAALWFGVAARDKIVCIVIAATVILEVVVAFAVPNDNSSALNALESFLTVFLIFAGELSFLLTKTRKKPDNSVIG